MQDDFSTTLHEGELSQQEKYINPYTDFACYSELERRQYEQLAIAQQMKADNMPVNFIAKYTNLTEEEIDKL